MVLANGSGPARHADMYRSDSTFSVSGPLEMRHSACAIEHNVQKQSPSPSVGSE